MSWELNLFYFNIKTKNTGDDDEEFLGDLQVDPLVVVDGGSGLNDPLAVGSPVTLLKNLDEKLSWFTSLLTVSPKHIHNLDVFYT